MKKRIGLITLAAAFIFILGACGAKGTGDKADKVEKVKIGVVSESAIEIWKDVAKRLKDQNIDLEVVEFTDYNQPNIALKNGDIDLNAFQHVAFLEDFNKNNDADLTPIGFTFVSPLGIYSEKIKDIKELKDGDSIAIPNDVTNGGRALLLLQALDLIKLDTKAASPTVNDITENTKNIQIKELDAAQTARSLQDVAAAVVNTNYAVDAGFSPKKDALYLDTDNISEVKDIYKNVIAARKADKDNKVYKKVVAEYQTEATKKLIDSTTNGTDIPIWDAK
ncbi:MetQ/NlpA family ABC transporter substrate-binding protein [Carnobacterium maltaromaticum]|jgi:D-methionine transport system substrate-binding protein|uniref:Lipoprotein n=2 Tax=Carnobacterium maltaromaticum TaxID=2751 RepID=K8E1N0_CARML|nr:MULTISPECIES: MetQ/NlpA family ABC transporter substrate-binding protein [Carnobacterium]AOA03622.1 metal ABC transporter substrate-binding protein [Carnobacterium maltaromaticum]KRN59758.1 YaeC family lipoprotein [Carnobacterium maltaromaticum DSM 20342]KRN73165.1 YaeC family lipoprotein [Carnobacterium maltaromaticum]MBC9787000.1 MetQ/NlpA family ABC transporter substrate-binding protein [Carnobacterium maltaromaticum]MBQ6485667.1 MetQ/NlpA family ABC transporter substrate-binding protein